MRLSSSSMTARQRAGRHLAVRAVLLTPARMESATETRRHEAPRVRRAAQSAGHTAERGRARVDPIITRLVHDACRPRAGPAPQAHASNPIGVYTAPFPT